RFDHGRLERDFSVTMLGDGFSRCIYIDLAMVQLPMQENDSFVSVWPRVWSSPPSLIKSIDYGIFGFQIGESRIDDVVIFGIRANADITIGVDPFFPDNLLYCVVKFVRMAGRK